MQEESDAWYREAPAIVILSILIGMMVLAALMAGGVTIASAVMYNLDPTAAMEKLSDNPDATVRSFFRWSQGASHFLIFIVSAIATIYVLLRTYKIKKPYFDGVWAPNWRSYFNLERSPRLEQLLLGIALLICTLPLVQYTYQINKALPLADWMRTMESDAAAAIKGLLTMDTPFEFIGNLLIIAILPAIGEELVFRGLVQPQLQKTIGNHWVAILITSLIFSAIHMQFEGFLPRMLLGVVLGWLYWQTRNLWIPIIAHLFNNGVQVIGIYLYKTGMTEIDLEQDVEIPWYAAFVSLLFVIGLGYLMMQNVRKRSFV